MASNSGYTPTDDEARLLIIDALKKDPKMSTNQVRDFLKNENKELQISKKRVTDIYKTVWLVK